MKNKKAKNKIPHQGLFESKPSLFESAPNVFDAWQNAQELFVNAQENMLCGIDEAGRGSLCGSLFVSGVACTKDLAQMLQIQGIKDSKKTTKNTRKNLANLLIHTPGIHFCIIEKTAKEIDEKGLSCCMRECLQSIIKNLQSFTSHFIMDGNTTFGFHPPPPLYLKTLIKGDALLPQISAASVLAKYAKDCEMMHLDKIYPNYGFASHSGYGTSAHIAQIKALGPTKEHRRNFLKDLTNPMPKT
ncbi:ribonuclease HII [Helicobacter mustelae]|uniref:Ribonuclease n=1 Tax=Helicobacter mustelae (strain ATCC 43772 / CCUG 25715 / CIP 103759 / LMG 18044 / NCTC 12198 / R85-136P) TaxID=679897 RepID=D3UIJ2_HELM1|nr:ribonuclease HII [Helicobacter mustelae]CBG40315.1 ribonuclease HII [Helicobacter mustelae 12198]SQH71814.1 ribonuclease HII [Helicobacter mustelae]STP12943.1 ribonuclease HII [Helicobacter mustelae]